jgi:lipid-A-disaccharide synthase
LRILLSAGEVSGDRIGARIAQALLDLAPGTEIAGCAGPGMVSAGVRSLADPSAFSHSGWESVISRAPSIAWRAWRYLRSAREFGPDLVVAVDSPGLHAPLLRGFRRRKTPCVWIAPPQLWAWKDRRPPVLRGLRVHPLHEFETEALRRAGADPLWLGYPGERPERAQGSRDLLALLPGSRPHWRRAHSKLFREAARTARTGLETVLVHPDPPGPTECGLRCMAPDQALSRAAVALCLPGTSTLEVALQGIPLVVAARPGRLDAWMASRRLAEGPWALPSRILGAPCCPELFGAAATPEAIGEALRDAARLVGRQPAFDGLPRHLGPSDAAARIARSILDRP